MLASMKAKCLDLTSASFKCKRCSSAPAPMTERPYQAYGHGEGLTLDGAQQRYNGIPAKWHYLRRHPDRLPRVSRRKPLTDANLKRAIGGGNFSSLHVLTDEVLGKTYVTLPNSLGNGVKLEGTPMSAEEVDAIKSRLAGSGHFHAMFAGSPRIDAVAHLVCEVQQAVLAGKSAAIRQFDLDCVEKLEESAAPREDARDLKRASLATKPSSERFTSLRRKSPGRR